MYVLSYYCACRCYHIAHAHTFWRRMPRKLDRSHQEMETRERNSRSRVKQSMREVFRKKTYSLRQELQMETDALNSMLFSGGLIYIWSRVGKEGHASRRYVTLSAIRSTLEDESIAEKTFHGFTRTVSDIASKSHLARELEKGFRWRASAERRIRLPPTGSLSHQSGRDLDLKEVLGSMKCKQLMSRWQQDNQALMNHSV